jgi:hypothetical protein
MGEEIMELANDNEKGKLVQDPVLIIKDLGAKNKALTEEVAVVKASLQQMNASKSQLQVKLEYVERLYENLLEILINKIGR